MEYPQNTQMIQTILIQIIILTMMVRAALCGKLTDGEWKVAETMIGE